MNSNKQNFENVLKDKLLKRAAFNGWNYWRI